jgi:RimJ/RimL family protein N-acetyltransferase
VRSPYRPRAIGLRDGRAVTLRSVLQTDAPEIVQAFERLSDSSRYFRFAQHKNQLNDAALERGVHPRPGRDFVFVATVPAADGIDIVGAAQYVPADERSDKSCEFAITVAEDWRRSGLATRLLASLVRRARRDGYKTMEGWVIAGNTPMLALARKLDFVIEPVAGDATVRRVQRALQPNPGREPAQRSARGPDQRRATLARRGSAGTARRRRS